VVADAMVRDVVCLRVDKSIADAVVLVASRTFSRVPVVDERESVLGVVPVAQLRNATNGTEPVTTLMQAASVIRSDAPLLRAVVRMNNLGLRQLIVVDAETETKLVGILAMSDLVRAHARAASESPRTVGSPRPLPELIARALMIQPTLVDGSATLLELVARQRDGDAKVFIVRENTQEFSIVLPEQLQEFARDETLRKMLIAADLAQPAPIVTDVADVAALVDAIREEGTEAALVVDGRSGEPVGVVTKTALARAFVDWYAHHPSLLSDRPPEPGTGEGVP
jgi:CBS-domain-containing membrane protein